MLSSECSACRLICHLKVRVAVKIKTYRDIILADNSHHYLGATLTNRNSIHEEIQSRLKSANGCYYSAQNLLSSRLLSKNTKIRASRIIILPAVLCGCETWSLTLREGQRLRVFENRVLRWIFGPKRDEATGK
jgi:hypothetical protein